MSRIYTAVPISCMIVLACASTPRANAQDGVLPRDLAEVARNVGCESVRRFYDRPGMVDPPYVYGVEDGDKEASVAFWCERVSDRSYLLVLRRANAAPKELRWTDYPGGLTMSEPADWNLAAFRRVDDISSSGPPITLRARRAVQSSYDGVIATFVEHDGVWYFRLLD